MEEIVLGEKEKVEGNGREIEALGTEKILGFVSSPTGTEVEGTKYIVRNGTGLFAGHNNAIAFLKSTSWVFRLLPPSFKGFSISFQGDRYEWSGLDWEEEDITRLSERYYNENDYLVAFATLDLVELHIFDLENPANVILPNTPSDFRLIAWNQGTSPVYLNTFTLNPGKIKHFLSVGSNWFVGYSN
jgi:hypothetical protein